MNIFRHTALLGAVFLLAGPARAADAWARLKLGMTALEATAMVGEPLMRSGGQGFQVWTYDDRAELVFYGPLVGWTAPHVGDAAATSVDVWQNSPDAAAGVRRVLPRPAAVGVPPTSPVGVIYWRRRDDA